MTLLYVSWTHTTLKFDSTLYDTSININKYGFHSIHSLRYPLDRKRVPKDPIYDESVIQSKNHEAFQQCYAVIHEQEYA